MSRWRVPLMDVEIGPEEIAAVTRVLRSGWISLGPETATFEEEFARFLGVPYAVAVASGTAALHLACLALGLGEGDEVLCPALTFVATANAILYTGARPVFVDVTGPEDLNISLADAARKLSPRTKALMLVHYGGYPCDLEGALELARQYRLKIIEDAAHAPGACPPGPGGPRMVGTVGDLGCFSFFANKNLTTGEGGMVVTKDPELAARIKRARSHGQTALTWDRHQGHSFSYDVVSLGYNYRLDEMRAALGRVQLRKLPAANARRRTLTRRYREKLKGIPGLTLPFASDPEGSACHLFPVILPPGVDRERFMAALAAEGIQTSVHYPPVPSFSLYKQMWPPGFDHHLPQLGEISPRLVSLPLYPGLEEWQQDLVVAAVLRFLKAR